MAWLASDARFRGNQKQLKFCYASQAVTLRLTRHITPDMRNWPAMLSQICCHVFCWHADDTCTSMNILNSFVAFFFQYSCEYSFVFDLVLVRSLFSILYLSLIVNSYASQFFLCHAHYPKSGMVYLWARNLCHATKVIINHNSLWRTSLTERTLKRFVTICTTLTRQYWRLEV